MLNVDLPISSSSQSECQSSIIFFLKIDFRKEIGVLTESGPLSDSAASFANLSASSFLFLAHVSFDPRNVYMLIRDKPLTDLSSCCVSTFWVGCRLDTRLIVH
ncbi:hypothetical protein AVEN_203468-1 [Araneus ventricosus]|uniref:Uncharacterized protein n=1 Tax=Araneus ventricosus TaxID=182803 RepID=A0A4Y2BJI4_ARAVE|nr:hypothetical protein AVEN_203468-1 [Araneus ventricosus]